MTDARFEDGAEGPLRLLALTPPDVPVLAALVQDAVFAVTEMTYAKGRHRFAVLVNRFRWEDKEAAAAAGRAFERVQALITVETVLSVQTIGIDRAARETVLSLLDVVYSGPAEGPGQVQLILAGGGAISLRVEALEISLRDTTRPHLAVSGKAPVHL